MWSDERLQPPHRAQRPRHAAHRRHALWLGPVIGAILLGSAQQIATVTISSEVNILVVGLLLIAFVVAAPEGLLGLAAALRERLLAREKRTERTA